MLEIVLQQHSMKTAVDQEFKELRQVIINEIKTEGEEVVLCGGGRMDSPGFSATKGTYTVMHHSSRKTLENGVWRQTRGKVYKT